MKKLAMAAVAALVMTSAFASGPTTGNNTLWGQENGLGTGGLADGWAAINGGTAGPLALISGNPALGDKSNWLKQGGHEDWSAVYSWDGSAWVDNTTVGDGSMDIEADIEMYAHTTIDNNKMYFHLGNIYEARLNPTTQLRAFVTATLDSNNGQYVGFKMPGKTDADMEMSGANLTGKIIGGMVGTKDAGGRDISAQKFDVQLLCSTDSGSWTPPESFGAGAHGTITSTLWWAPVAAGHHNMTYMVDLQPNAHQADGNYHLDPIMVVAPEL